ncbi:cytochrome b5-like heme steroid binding domain-containing protein [Fusarium mexicanum]|uniref:Cytochrome b5-like heme steroid binding domain-containing protein n=1 Tax=Fusarium mexicanum TaxID=751941 RepID=A0A8H5ICI1_9HYPO|nr:cytochrome b5-like heme steroid binding domain-containing protein [Fusarium mexicanum]
MPSVHTTISESVITVEELAEHGTLDKLWIAVHGRVYNLTAFSSDHPGGVDALEMSAGRDGTEAYEYAGHSEENMGKMQQYYVGNIAGSLEHAFTSPVETSKGSSAVSDLQLLNAPRIRLTAAIIATSFIGAVLSHCCTPSAQNVSSPQSPTTLNQNPRLVGLTTLILSFEHAM